MSWSRCATTMSSHATRRRQVWADIKCLCCCERGRFIVQHYWLALPQLHPLSHPHPHYTRTNSHHLLFFYTIFFNRWRPLPRSAWRSARWTRATHMPRSRSGLRPRRRRRRRPRRRSARRHAPVSRPRLPHGTDGKRKARKIIALPLFVAFMSCSLVKETLKKEEDEDKKSKKFFSLDDLPFSAFFMPHSYFCCSVFFNFANSISCLPYFVFPSMKLERDKIEVMRRQGKKICFWCACSAAAADRSVRNATHRTRVAASCKLHTNAPSPPQPMTPTPTPYPCHTHPPTQTGLHFKRKSLLTFFTLFSAPYPTPTAFALLHMTPPRALHLQGLLPGRRQGAAGPADLLLMQNGVGQCMMHACMLRL